MDIAITGHMGLIGAFLKRRLEDAGHNIIFSVDLQEGKDILDLKNKIVDFKIDMMIHMASHCKIKESIIDPQKTYKNNVEGTFSVFEFCRKNKIPKIIFFSSSRVLNKEKNPYVVSKIYGEELCKGYKDSYDIDYLIIRPSTVYGPIWDKTKRLVHIFIMNALDGKDLEIYGDPKTKTLDFTYVDDFVDGVMLAMAGEWNREYNISGEEEFKIYNLAEKIISQVGSKSKILIRDAEILQPQKVSVDISEMKSLSYTPKVKLEEGIKKTIEFYKNYQDCLRE